MRQHAVSRLDCDQSYIENRCNGESGPERGRRMAVTMAVIMMVAMMMTVVMRVMRRHAFDSRSPALMLEHFRVGGQRAPCTCHAGIM
jgi:hypothetical protein